MDKAKVRTFTRSIRCRTYAYGTGLVVDTLRFYLAGGANGGCFYSKRYAALSGLNSSNLDFMPVQNFDDEVVVGGVGAVPVGT